jgi:hypothetical protein
MSMKTRRSVHLAMTPGLPKAEEPSAPPAPAEPQAQAPQPATAPAAVVPAATDVVYVCEMGCEVLDKPGKCPKCNMTLLEVKRGDIAYVCGICGHEAGQPGACPKDQTVLVFKLKQLSDGPGARFEETEPHPALGMMSVRVTSLHLPDGRGLPEACSDSTSETGPLPPAKKAPGSAPSPN